MALVTCPDCKREVSDQAPVCPGCGRPMKPVSSSPPESDRDAVRRSVGRTMVAIGTICVLGGLVYAIAADGVIGCFAMAFGFCAFVMGRLKQD